MLRHYDGVPLRRFNVLIANRRNVSPSRRCTVTTLHRFDGAMVRLLTARCHTISMSRHRGGLMLHHCAIVAL
jgi:hypothetical protein